MLRYHKPEFGSNNFSLIVQYFGHKNGFCFKQGFKRAFKFNM